MSEPRVRYEYKVLSQNDRWFFGKMDPAKLEVALNELAKDGWRVVSSASQAFQGLIRGDRDEMVIILEREYVSPPPPLPRVPKVEAMPVMRACPHCKGQIDETAKRCMHCLEKVTPVRS